MALTKDDLREIRNILRDEVRTIVREEVRPIVREEVRDEVAGQLIPIKDQLTEINGRLIAAENDIKDIYEMIADLQKLTRPVAHFEKFNLEQKLLKLNSELLAAAKQAGIDLPRS